MSKALYIGCNRDDCKYVDNKNNKCTRIVLMHDHKGRCKSYASVYGPSFWQTVISKFYR